jgi:FixJ family two-component response regulator
VNYTNVNELDASPSAPVILVVDDDVGICQALGSLFGSVGLRAMIFRSTAELLARPLPDAISCLVLDVRLPGVGGLQFQRQLSQAGVRIPIIFITGYGDIPMSVCAMKEGAVDFLVKPFRDQDLLDAVRTALARDQKRRESDRMLVDLRERLASLSRREREVFDMVTRGLLNKQIADEIGLSEVTVKIHRGNLMKKMRARSVAELVKMSVAVAVSDNQGDPAESGLRGTAFG